MQGKSLPRIRSQIIQGVLVTQDTTGVVLSNIISMLSRTPEVCSRIRGEVASLGPVEGWNATDLKNLKLLHSVIKESKFPIPQYHSNLFSLIGIALRLYPLFHANSRVAIVDTTLPTSGGPHGSAPIFIPVGTKVSTNFYTLHRQTSVFGEDIASFGPDRWDHIAPDRWDHIAPDNGEFMPFSHGPCSCAGRHKAFGESSYIIARMAVQFKQIKSCDDRPWTEDVKLVVKNGNNCKVALYTA